MNIKKLFKHLVEVEVNRICPLQRRGRPRLLQFNDAFDSLLRVVRTGMQWRELKPDSVSHITVFKWTHLWMREGVFKTAYTRLLRLYQRDKRPKYYCIDSSYVKNVYGRDCTGRNPTDRGRRATKLSAVVDDLGIPVSLLAAPGNVSDQRLSSRPWC